MNAAPRAPENADGEAIEVERLLVALEKRSDYDLRHDVGSWLRRRVRRHREEESAPSYASLAHAVLRDEAAAGRLVARPCLRQVSRLQPSSLCRAIRERVVPLVRTYPCVRIWGAGCATGEEARSLAIFHEEGAYERARIYATDLSDELLARARSGALPLAMRRYEARYRAAGGRRALSDYVVTDGDRAVVRHELRRNLVFSRHDLAASDGSFNEFHVVLSRNVARRYAGPVRERVHRVVHDSLARDGILALGRRESLRSTGLAHRYRPLDAGAGLYRRIR